MSLPYLSKPYLSNPNLLYPYLLNPSLNPAQSKPDLSSPGQTILHCHIHIIPRRKGDVIEPQGGESFFRITYAISPPIIPNKIDITYQILGDK